MADNSRRERILDTIDEVMALHEMRLAESERQAIEKNGDYSGVINATQQRMDELRQKSNELLKEMGLSREELEIYASNRANFTPQEWELLEEVRRACANVSSIEEELLSDQLQGGLTESPKNEHRVKKEKKKDPKKMAKRKNWIQL